MHDRVLALLSLQTCLLLGGVAVIATAPTSPPPDTVIAGSRSVHNVRPLIQAFLRPAPTATPTRTPRATMTPKPVTPQPAARKPPPTRAQHPGGHRRASARARVSPALTPQRRLDLAIARIPGYRTGEATWRLQAKDGYWGTADWYTDTIWISPRVPAKRLYDVAVHEWSHLKSVRAYGGNVDLAISEMNRYFGGTGLTGPERAADCMARVDGADWTHYTSCTTATWRSGATRLLAGQRL